MQANTKGSRRLENCQGLNCMNSSQSAHLTGLWQYYACKTNKEQGAHQIRHHVPADSQGSIHRQSCSQRTSTGIFGDSSQAVRKLTEEKGENSQTSGQQGYIRKVLSHNPALKRRNQALARKVSWLERRLHSGLDTWSGHIEESANECINKWNNKTNACLSLSKSRFKSKKKKSNLKLYVSTEKSFDKSNTLS